MTDTTKLASPVNDVKMPSSNTPSGNPPSKAELKADAKLKTKQAKLDAQQSIEEVGDSMRRKPGRWGSAGAGLLAAATAVGVLIWRKQCKPRTPREKVARAWRDA